MYMDIDMYIHIHVHVHIHIQIHMHVHVHIGARVGLGISLFPTICRLWTQVTCPSSRWVVPEAGDFQQKMAPGRTTEFRFLMIFV
jgi:hypothetical protein